MPGEIAALRASTTLRRADFAALSSASEIVIGVPAE
jgi:hypothetical protein